MKEIETIKKCKDCIFSRHVLTTTKSLHFCVNFSCYAKDMVNYASGGFYEPEAESCQAVRRDSLRCAPEGKYYLAKPKAVTCQN